jgi:hypothetical protein
MKNPDSSELVVVVVVVATSLHLVGPSSRSR